MQNSAVLSCALSYALFHFYFTSNTNSYNKTVQFSFILHCFCKSYFFFPSTFLKVEVNFSLQPENKMKQKHCYSLWDSASQYLT